VQAGDELVSVNGHRCTEGSESSVLNALADTEATGGPPSSWDACLLAPATTPGGIAHAHPPRLPLSLSLHSPATSRLGSIHPTLIGCDLEALFTFRRGLATPCTEETVLRDLIPLERYMQRPPLTAPPPCVSLRPLREHQKAIAKRQALAEVPPCLLSGRGPPCPSPGSAVDPPPLLPALPLLPSCVGIGRPDADVERAQGVDPVPRGQ
jgi:hypothetical protein